MKFHIEPQKFRKESDKTLKITVKIICNIQYIKLKENRYFKMGNLTLTEILRDLYNFFLNFCGGISNVMTM